MTTTPAPVYGGRYELRNQIARGGTAQVYLARDLLLDRPVALKVLFPELSTDHSFVERFRREAQAAANLMHPNIVQVFDWGESDRTYFIVMEYIDGEPLSSIIRSQAPLAGPQAASIASDIAKALSYAHRHGVVHRDVKPGNVLITADGQVKVTDFGIARAIGTDEQVTQTGLVMGTATYFSPEQAQGLAVDARSDVYALGVVLYEMLTGRPPFSGETPVAIAYQHVREQPPALRTLNPAIPAALEAVVQQAMAKLPAERYVSADEMKADLDRFVHGQTVLASPPRTTGSTGPVTTVLAATGAGQRGGIDTSVVAAIDGGDAGERRQKSTTPWWLAGGLLLVVAIGVVVWFGGRSLGYFGGTSAVQVPNVVHESLTAARTKLKGLGLDPVIVSTVAATPADIAEAGTVKSQTPAPPKTVASGGIVHLVVWGDPPSAHVPSVYGQTLTNAESALTNAGFKYTIRPFTANSAGQQQGSIYRQIPTGGTSEPQGSKIVIYEALGSKVVSVPKVSGDSVFLATSTLDNLHFHVTGETSQSSSTVPQGNVIGTNPPANSQELPGADVTLIVSTGPATVPSLAGDTLAQAEAVLTTDGFTYRPALDNSATPSQVGYVVYTSPATGTTVKPGRQIVIFVGAQNGSTTTTTPGSTTSTTTPGSTTTTAAGGTTTTTTAGDTTTTTTTALG